jgi:hypothetical protein
MLPVLLQVPTTHTTTITTSDLTNVYIALGGTLFASGLAAYASFRASIKASATAREVAELSNRTARDLKEKEYKNDYYKKVIDKRIKALDEVEKLLALFATSQRVTIRNREEVIERGSCYTYFHNNVDTLNSNELAFTFNKESSVLFWCSKTTSELVANFYNFLLDIIKGVNDATQVREAKMILYTRKFTVVKDKISQIEISICDDMKNLYDVEAFLEEKRAYIGSEDDEWWKK